MRVVGDTLIDEAQTLVDRHGSEEYVLISRLTTAPHPAHKSN